MTAYFNHQPTKPNQGQGTYFGRFGLISKTGLTKSTVKSRTTGGWRSSCPQTLPWDLSTQREESTRPQSSPDLQLKNPPNYENTEFNTGLLSPS